jgi:RimJ/RimL family protein N-acetyltransferase
MEPILFPTQETHAESSARTRLSTTGRRQVLPVLRGRHVTLRALRASDAKSLVAFLTAPEVARFISAPPDTLEGFERFIECTDYHQSAGKVACFAVTLSDDTAVGVVQMRETEPDFRSVEWGFALGPMFWGTGVFQEAAELALEFAFEQLGAHRVEARAAAKNGRGCRALHKLGAVPEGVLRRSLLCDGQYLDQVLYAIVEDDWRANRRRRRELSLLH